MLQPIHEEAHFRLRHGVLRLGSCHSPPAQAHPGVLDSDEGSVLDDPEPVPGGHAFQQCKNLIERHGPIRPQRHMTRREVRVRQIQLSRFTECGQHEAQVGILEIKQHALWRCADGRRVLRRERRRADGTAQQPQQNTTPEFHQVPALGMRMTTVVPLGVANSAAPFVTRLKVQSPTR